MRLPNGYGGIVHLGGNRRKPYMARKTIDYKPNGTPIYYVVGYYPTKEEALIGLANYNQSPSIPSTTTTLSSVFRNWLEIHSREVSKSTMSNYHSSYKHLAPICGMSISNIKYQDLQSIMDTMISKGLSYSSLKKVRSLINQLYEYATINELVDKSYNKHLKLGRNTPRRPHRPFTRQKINKLWSSEHPYAHIPLLMLYTGMRSIELRSLLKSNVNMKQKYFNIVASKTMSGVRVIPIHKKILPIVERLIAQEGKYLLGDFMSYSTLSKHFNDVMTSINAKHTTHDCRHTFATMLDSAEANPNAKRKLLGHKNGDVTDKVYTHKSLRDLRRAINLLR